MDPATLLLLARVIEMLLSTAASLPSVVSAGQTAIALLQSNTDPTAHQEAAIRLALDDAHAALQAA